MNNPTLGRDWREGKKHFAHGCMPSDWDDKKVLQYVTKYLPPFDKRIWKVINLESNGYGELLLEPTTRVTCPHHSPNVLMYFEEIEVA